MTGGYPDLERVAREVEAGRHRDCVGGLWQEIGRLQLEFLLARGLEPRARVLDLGCGCLRAGVHLVEYLEPGRYYGIDVSRELLDAGYDVELARLGLGHKLPRRNLLCDGEFQCDRFGVRFDLAIAQSLFTHLSLNHVKLCLARLAPAMKVGGVFYATFFRCGEGQDWTRPLHHPRGGITTFPAANPYHYRDADLETCAAGLPWAFAVLGEWDHPRDQVMSAFTRLPDPAPDRS